MGADVAGSTGGAVRENEGLLSVGEFVVSTVDASVSAEVPTGVGAGVADADGVEVDTTVGAEVGGATATEVLALRVRVERL